MNSRFKKFLSMLMAFTMLMQYTFTIQVFAEDNNEGSSTETVQEEKAEKAAAEKAAAEKAAAEKAAAEKAAAEKAAAEKAAAEKAAAEKAEKAKEEAAPAEKSDNDDPSDKSDNSEQAAAPAEQHNEQTEGPEEDSTPAEDASMNASEQLDLEQARAPDSEEMIAEEEALEEENEEEAEEEEEEKFPKFSHSQAVGNMTVNINAPEGALPEGVKVSIRPVSASQIEDAVKARMGENAEVVKAVDITFYNKDGKEVSPKKAISVKFVSREIRAAENPSVLHIDDNGRAEMADHGNVAGSTASFKSDDFSIYAVVEEGSDARLKVIFKSNGSEVASVLVKKGDNINAIVYDPGAGELESGVVFKGWTVGESYTASTEPKTIDGIHSEIEAKLNEGVTDGEEMIVTAMLFKQYKVNYLDEKKVSLGSDSVEVVVDGDASASYRVNMAYTPADDEHNFEGWLVSDGKSNISGYTEGKEYQNGDEITISGNVTFSVDAPEGHWLIFDENGKGATYNAPQFVESGHATVQPSGTMARNGYTFGGWYKDAACSEGNEFSFGGSISETTTIYAKWTAIANANYTVIIWKENITCDGYDFVESVSLSGRPGTTINTVTQQGTGDNAYARVGGTNKQYTGFHLKEFDQNVTIAPEGNAVLNVYYDRTSYTLTFRMNRTGTVYKTITAKYQQPIGENFPITSNGANAEWRWSPQSSATFKQVLVYIDIMPAENVTFFRSTSTAGNKYMEFYVEALPGQTADRRFNGKNFVKYGNTITAKYNFFTEAEDFLDLTGFEKFGSDPAFNNGRADVATGGTIRFYYTRQHFPINFMDGVYVDGNGNPISESGMGQIGTEEGIEFGADTSSYNSYKPSRTPSGYVFEGWYSDDKCTHAYNFTTMPEGGITVYAKWRQVQYRVFLHPNAGTDPTLDWGSEGQAMNFRVSNGGTVSVPTGLRKGYTFVGWYTDEACTHVFNANTRLNESTVTTPYNKSSHMTDPMDKWGNGATSNADTDRPWITKEFNLYAKWRSELDGADGIRISYDANGGSGAPSDTNEYVDGATATAGAASKAPSSDQQFSHWVIEKSGLEIEPGQSFTVNVDDADVKENEDGTKEYVIMIKAIYSDKEEDAMTSITYNANGGSGADIVDELKVNQGTTARVNPFTRTGYQFDSWNTMPDGSGLKFEQGAKIAADLLDREKNTSINTLYAQWKAEIEVQVEGSESTVTYNGAEQSNAAYTVKYLVAGVEAELPAGFTAEITGEAAKGTDVGTYNETVTVAISGSAAGYIIKTASASDDLVLNIEKAPLKVSTGSGEKEYDGAALTNAEASLEGLVGHDAGKATAVATGSQTEVGSSENTYEISWNEVNENNYELTEELGTLVVTESTAEITLTAASDSKVYDGSALENAEVTASGLPAGFTAEATASGSQTDAGESENVVNDGYVIKNAAGVDKTANFTKISKINGTLTVTPAAVVISTGSGEKEYDGTALTNEEASIEGLAGEESVTLTATGSQTEVGSSDNTYEIIWDNAKSSNYTVSQELGTLKVTVNTAQVTLTAASDSKTYDGTALTNAEVTASGLPAGFTAEAAASGSQTDAGESANKVNDGYVIKDAAGNDKTANFTNVQKVDGKLTVNPKAVTITTGSDSKKYDGTPLTNEEAEIEGLADGESVTLAATGSQTEVGSSDNTYEIEWDNAKESNYTVTESLGTLTVTTSDAEVVLTAASGSKTYDGTPLTNAEVTASGLPEGFTAEATASGSQTDAGESANVVNDGYVIRDAEGNDKTAMFTNIEKVDGKLTVNPKAVTVSTGSASKAYDGTPLTNDEAEIEGLIEGESVTLAATGSQTEVGSSQNGYSIEWDNAKASNYEVTNNLGTLEVTENAALVKLTAASDEKVYDGSALENAEVTASGLPEGFSAEAVAEGSQINAGQSANVVADGYVIRDAEGNDKTANFTNIQKVDGTLKVTPKAVTITTGSDSKEYDGTALTNEEASIEGLVDGESVTLAATGSQTEVGTSDNTYEIEWDNAEASNYEITEELGTLEVTITDAEVTLTAASDEKVYDGTALENAEVTASGLPEGFTVEAVAEGSQTDAGQSANAVADGYIIRDAEGNDKTANFSNINKVDGTLTVTPKAVTITTGSDSKEYDGTPLTNDEAEIEGLADGESVTLAATGSQTEIGSSDNTYSIEWDNAKASNYEITEELGTLEVTSTDAEVTLTAASDEKVYDGTALENAEVTAEGLPEGFTAEAQAVGSQTDAGESANEVADGYIIRDAEGNDKTANFTNIQKVDGTLTVTPKPVVITTGSDSKEYDGTPLTNDEAEIDGLADGESVTLEATGSQTEVGSSANTYNIIWDNAKASNYEVSNELGTLEVTENTAKVTLTAATDSKIYDGTALENAEVTAEGLPEGFTAEAAAEGSQINAGESANVVADGYIIKDSEGNDKTANFTNIEKVDGKLTVNPKAVTITTGSDSKKYDGTALTSDVAEIEGLVEGESVTLAATGSQTEVGSSENTYEIEWDNADEANYAVTENLGTLTVTSSDVQVILTAASDSKTYDGTALENAEVTVSGLPARFTFEASASGSQTDAGESANVVDDGYAFFDANGEDKTANFTSVQKVDGKLTVNPKAVTITTGSDSKEYDGTPLINEEAEIEGLVDGESVTLAATGSQTEVGTSDNTYSIVWDNAKESNYEVTDNLGTLEVTKNSAKVTLTAASDEKVYDGTALENAEVTAEGLPEGFTVEAKAEGSQTNAGESANVVADGYIIKDAAGADKTANFTNIETVDGTLTVTKAPVTIKTGSDEKVYDGKPLTKDEASIEGLADGESVTLKATGSQTDAGSSENTYEIEWDNAEESNYEVSEELGTLTVTKAKLPEDPDDPDDPANKRFEVSQPEDTVYNGLEQKQPVVVTDTVADKTLAEGTDYEISYTDAVDVGEVTITIKGIGNYEGTFTRTYKITPAPLVIRTGSDEKVYDGKPLTKDEASIEGLVNGETAEAKANGSQTDAGSSDNTYELTWGTAKASNYEITDELGTLTVTKAKLPEDPDDPDDPANKRFEVSQPEDTVYNGLEQKQPVEVKDNVAGKTLAEGTDYEISYTDAVDVGEVTITIKGIGNYEGTFTRIYKITPAPLTIKTGSDEKVYDGTPLTKDEASIEGLVNGETAEVKANGSQTSAGSSDNTYELIWGTAKASNYEITDELGTLTVTKAKLPEDPDDPDDPANKRFEVSQPEDTVYNGLEQKQPVEVKDNVAGKTLVEGTDYEISYSDAVNAGEVTITIKGIGNYEGTFTRTYRITPARLVVRTDSARKVYDGKALTDKGHKITGLVNGETASANVTGKQTRVGSSDNTAKIRWNGTAKASNYTVEYVFGKLTVTRADNPEPGPGPGPRPRPNPPAPTPGFVPGPAPAPAPDQAPADEVIDDEPVPQVEPEEAEIPEPAVPLAEGAWALINLICAALATIGSVVEVFRKKEDDDEEEDENGEDGDEAAKAAKAEGSESSEEEEEKDNRGRNMTIAKVIGALAAVASIVAFILTEDMSLPMVLTDKWTLLMALLFAGQIASAIGAKKAAEKKDDEEDGENGEGGEGGNDAAEADNASGEGAQA